MMARRPRSNGEHSRGAILHAAVGLATVEGLEGLSIGRLAEAVGMSKSGLFAHFGSKQQLQLATVETASTIFAAKVTEPAARAPTGIDRLRRLVDGYLRYVAEDTFPGGCFIASALPEVGTRPGPVRDRLVTLLEDWLGDLERAVRDAQAEGAIDPSEDPMQLLFEIEAALMYANAQHVITRTLEPTERARQAIERRITQ